MEPKYFIENRYSFVVDALSKIDQVDYEVDTPETSFERNVQRQLAIANRLLMARKYSSALAKYRHIRGLIAATLRPQISVLNGTLVNHSQFDLAQIADPLVAVSANLLSQTPVTASTLPEKFRSSKVNLPTEVVKQFTTFEQVGLKDREAAIGTLLDEASVLIKNRQFKPATRLFEQALEQTEASELRGALLHDLAILQERSGDRPTALQTMQRSVKTYSQIDQPEAQITALTTLAGIQARGKDEAAANQTLKTISNLQQERNVFPIVVTANTRVAETELLTPTRSTVARLNEPNLPLSRSPLTSSERVVAGTPSVLTPNLSRPTISRETITRSPSTPVATRTLELNLAEIEAQPVELLAATAFGQRQTQKQMTIVDSQQTAHAIQLNGNAASELSRFYTTLQTTQDVGLLMGYLQSYTVTVAYLTHVYAWVIPMAMGDCLVALGDYAAAEREYLSTLNYRYLNEVVEVVNLWLRLAELYLDWGDRLYRQARNDVSEFSKAREKYENVLLLNNTIRSSSPLYQSPKFSRMSQRVNTAIQALFVNSTHLDENPRLLIALWRARHQIFKIDNELNFIGLGVHIPPFSFEYLQNLARYFAQHASQVEQMYIQFQSTGENEELREQQMAQQAELAIASVELEQRGVNEAQEGVDVAQANFNYTQVQINNAIALRDQFNSVKSELQELSRLQAWAGAASNDEVKLKVDNATYYSTDSKPRSHVLFDLANRRAQISNQIESTRLQHAVNSANAYSQVAQQQVQQAQARVAVAEQRVAIAQLQAQHAQENLAFLSEREFTSALWYNLAREARRLAQRYLDMAIEVATLMEKAYEAETGRDLRKIKFEYGLDRLNGLLGSEALLLDVDYFSLDAVRTKSKKAQMKQIISLADTFPSAFNQLLQTGQTFFETTLEHFDRRYPGFYLQKVKQVELVFVGLNGTEGIHGTLRNIGLSQFRQKNGTVVNQTYPADVMPLSDYNVKQDAIVFQLDSRELRLFENNGIATLWQLDLPLAVNTFDLGQILDIQMVLYYDGFFDARLEQQIKATLPAVGSGARALSLRLYAADELFFLKSQGTAELAIAPELFPANQTQPVLKHYRIQAMGAASTVAGLNLRIDFINAGVSHTFQLDSDGNADDASFSDPLDRSLFDTWRLTIDPADNPSVDLSQLDDIAVYVEYTFTYRH
ncbi:MAG: hypothetical protein ACTS3T_13090 [Almyronema sp.]